MKQLANLYQKAIEPYKLTESCASILQSEIEKAYTKPSRYYHTLTHLATMYKILQPVWNNINRPELIAFAILYHDVVYKACSKDNEERSAETAYRQMMRWNIPREDCQKVKEMILATKNHPDQLKDKDTAYLLDADLVVLGSPWPEYEAYCKGVRKEYQIYPGFLYQPGRKKVLQYFLSMENMYRTDYFRQNYEQQAKENLEREVALL